VRNSWYKNPFYRVNWQIRVSPIRLIDAQGKQLGVFPLEKAREIAKNQSLDLVEIAPKAKPPVVKLIDYAKFKYQEEKKRRQERKKQKSGGEIKEIRLTPFIGEADLRNKLERAKEFAQKNNKLKIVIKFIGRQITKKEFGYQTLERIKKDLADIYKPEEQPKLIGNRIILLMQPISKNEKEKI